MGPPLWDLQWEPPPEWDPTSGTHQEQGPHDWILCCNGMYLDGEYLSNTLKTGYIVGQESEAGSCTSSEESSSFDSEDSKDLGGLIKRDPEAALHEKQAWAKILDQATVFSGL